MSVEIVYRASEMGECVRALVAARLGHEEVRKQEMKELLQRSAREGDLHETWVKETLRERGWTVHREQELVRKIIVPGVVLEGHIDGTGIDMDRNERGLEVKSKSTKQFAIWARHGFDKFPNHAFQTSIYMHLTGLRWLQITKRREDGMIHELEVDTPPIEWRAIRNKILKAERYRRAQSYPPCDLDRKFGCPFFYLHDEDEVEVETANEEINDALGLLIIEYVKLKEQEDLGKESGKERKDRVVPDIMNLLGNSDQMEITLGDKRFRVSKRNASGVSFDKDAAIIEFGAEKMAEFEKPWRTVYPVIREVD